MKRFLLVIATLFLAISALFPPALLESLNLRRRAVGTRYGGCLGGRARRRDTGSEARRNSNRMTQIS